MTAECYLNHEVLALLINQRQQTRTNLPSFDRGVQYCSTMPGAASVASARTSVYHTAQSSSPDGAPTSPLAFWTPAPARDTVAREDDQEDDDDTPRATAFQQALDQKNTMPGSSPMLHRYIDQYAAKQETPTAADATPAETPRTRLQARLIAARSSPAPSTPASMTSTARKTRETSARPLIPRSVSPLVKQNMLTDVTPQSSAYHTKVKNSVDEVVKSLRRKGRATEGLALQELYRQSFKDAGTAELLDALLRQRANERQRKDFARYVEDTSKLNSQMTAGPNSSQTLSEQGMDENVEVISEVLPPDYVAPPSPRVVIEVPVQQPASADSVEPLPPGLSTTDIPQDNERHTPESATTSTISPVALAFSARHPDHAVIAGTTQENPEEVTAPSLTAPPAMQSQEVSSAKGEPLKQDNKPTKIDRDQIRSKLTTKREQPIISSGLKKYAPDIQSLENKQRRRRKKRKQRLFAAANGPVFSKAFIMP